MYRIYVELDGKVTREVRVTCWFDAIIVFNTYIRWCLQKDLAGDTVFIQDEEAEALPASIDLNWDKRK